MAPRKPHNSAPALVRRVVRTVTTEEFIEQPPGPTCPPPSKKSIAKSKPSAAANTSVRAPAAVKKQPNFTKATKQTNATARQSKAPKPTPAKGAAKKVEPKKTPAKSASSKGAAKKEEPKTSAALASKTTPAKSVSSKGGANNNKSAPGKGTKAKSEATKTKGVKNERTNLSVQRAIKKKSVPKCARKHVKKNSTAASSAPAANVSLDEVKQLHAELYARMLNDARQVARMEARAEMQRVEEQRQARAGTGLNRGSFSGQPSGGASRVVTPSIRARRVKQTARRTILNSAPSCSARGTGCAQLAASSLDANRGVNSNEVWVVTHETGYIADGFHCSETPRRQEAGTFANRCDAVREGKRVVGDRVGYSWAEVCEGGDLQVVEDSSHKWEVCWSGADSEFSRVVALRVEVSEGRWLVETESGYFADGFHSYMAPTKKTLGAYQTREIAVGVGKRHVGRVYGMSWEEVVSGGDLESVADSCTRWEVVWSAPDSEYWRVVVKLVGAAPSQSGRNRNTEDKRGDDDVDDKSDVGMYHTAAF